MEKIEKLLKSKWVDVLLIILLMLISILIRKPSLTLSGYDDISKEVYRDNENIPYFHDMDSYYYSTQVVRNIESNDLLDTYKNVNPYMIDYDGNLTGDKTSFLSFIVSFLYKITIKFTNISINKFIAIIGPILYSLCVIPAYLFVRRRTNRIGGITAGIIAGLNAAYLVSTGFSSFDTDILLCFLPLATITCFLEFIYSDTLKKQIIYSLLSVISFTILMFSWNSASVYFYLLIGMGALYLFIILLKDKFKFKVFFKDRKVLFIISIIIIYFLICLIFIGNINLEIITNVFNAVKEGSYLSDGLYPDPAKFVAELGSLPLLGGGGNALFNIAQYGVINRCGGIIAYLFLLVSIIYMFVQLFKKEVEFNDKLLIVFMLIWVIAGFISINIGSRFMKIFIIPALLIIGLGIGNLFKKIKKLSTTIIMLILVILSIWVPYVGAYTIAESQRPSANDALYETTEWLKENTKEDAIIASWWDYGYYYAYNGHRTTISNGGTYNGRFFYFLSKALITDDEDLCKGIFRMLATSGLDASYLVDEYLNSPKKGSELLKRILVLDKEKAEDVLKNTYYFTDKQTEKILELTHKELKSELIVIISQDMLSKVGAINYYGNYDFTDDFSASSELDENSMMSRLYYEDKVNGFEFLYKTDDITQSKSTRVWKAILD